MKAEARKYQQYNSIINKAEMMTAIRHVSAPIIKAGEMKRSVCGARWPLNINFGGTAA